MNAGKKTVGIGIVGAGFLAATRARCYGRVRGARMVGVCSRTLSSAEEYARKYGIPKVFDSIENLLVDPDIDLVDLCVPNLLHRPFAELAARAGKHVVCTKPLTAYVGQDLGGSPSPSAVSSRDRRVMLEVAGRDADAMVQVCEEAGVLLMYGENWIYAPSIARARQLMKSSSGSILEMRGHECHSGSHSPYSKTWKAAGGGALIRLASHPIGAMLHLKREEGLLRQSKPILPTSVTAEVSDLSQVRGLTEENNKVAKGWVDVENWSTVIVSFDDGSRGVAMGSDTMLGGMESKLEIMLSNAHLKCQLSPHDLLRAYAPNEEIFAEDYLMEKLDTKGGWSTALPNEDWSSGHEAMCADFVSAVAESRPPLADGQLGRDVTKVLYSAYRSASEGSRVTL